jgi:hypothetical protein
MAAALGKTGPPSKSFRCCKSPRRQRALCCRVRERLRAGLHERGYDDLISGPSIEKALLTSRTGDRDRPKHADAGQGRLRLGRRQLGRRLERFGGFRLGRLGLSRQRCSLRGSKACREDPRGGAEAAHGRALHARQSHRPKAQPRTQTARERLVSESWSATRQRGKGKREAPQGIGRAPSPPNPGSIF